MRDLAHTRFCLAPTGGGHGHRQILVAFSGCVPLLIGDSVLQPFEPEIDWTKFSVTVKQDKIPELHTLLSDIGPEAYAGMQRALHCGAQHMTFSSFLGSFQWDDAKYDAFETILAILRARIDNPGVAPEKLWEVDPDFRAFMECRSKDQDKWEPPSQPPTNLCLHSVFDADEHSEDACEPCFKRNNGIIPGGASCCKAASLAACPRAWE
ncbi:hypothetical protein FOA52_000395 [Chlamydomonas sp. UWO 241]|nr:hypothetical protein FOA52_000395 [Chlamydomonas sp. UWO 241]